MLLSECAVRDRKKFIFIKEREVSLGIKLPLRQIRLVGLLLFEEY